MILGLHFGRKSSFGVVEIRSCYSVEVLERNGFRRELLFLRSATRGSRVSSKSTFSDRFRGILRDQWEVDVVQPRDLNNVDESQDWDISRL